MKVIIVNGKEVITCDGNEAFEIMESRFYMALYATKEVYDYYLDDNCGKIDYGNGFYEIRIL